MFLSLFIMLYVAGYAIAFTASGVLKIAWCRRRDDSGVQPAENHTLTKISLQ